MAENPLPAFPGAEGFGAYTTGGRGGQVIKVTSLNAEGPGSLQAALDTNGPRIIVFEVGGTIVADELLIRHGDVTIAGQTAPAPGITIQGRLAGAYTESVGNIVIRHLKVRPKPDPKLPGHRQDAIQLSKNSNIILDHVSVAFGIDETIDLYESRHVTVQWSTIEMSATEGHREGQHNYGLINGPNGGHISILNNIFAHHSKRTPALAVGPAETTNNLIYNAKDAWVHHNSAKGTFVVEGNHFIEGPSADLIPIFLDTPAQENLHYFFSDNLITAQNGTQTEVQNPATETSKHPGLKYTCRYFKGGDCREHILTSRPDFSQYDHYRAPTTHSASDIKQSLLTTAGALPHDKITQQVVQDIEESQGHWGARYELLAGKAAPAHTESQDSDNDGMPDEWEISHQLDPKDPSDNTKIMPSGYTAIEEYINAVATSLEQQADNQQ